MLPENFIITAAGKVFRRLSQIDRGKRIKILF
jgi:hypothetical protein